MLRDEVRREDESRLDRRTTASSALSETRDRDERRGRGHTENAAWRQVVIEGC